MESKTIKFKVALHIGLPKTATTSIQENLLYPAHKAGHINYLGRYGSRFSGEYYNPFEKVFSELTKSKLDDDSILRLREHLFSLMKLDKLNVISEEILSSTHNFGYLRLENLQKILESCDVKVLISLRSPVDFFYSYYAECYRWKFHEEESINTIGKFAKKVVNDVYNEDFDIIHYGRFLPKVSNIFSQITIILFEDLRYDKQSYCEGISSFFNLEVSYVDSLLFKDIKNARPLREQGRVSEGVTVNQKINSVVEKYVSGSVRKKMKNITLIKVFYMLILRVFAKVQFKKSVQHIISDENTLIVLKNDLLVASSVFDEFGIDTEKLKKYGYCDDV